MLGLIKKLSPLFVIVKNIPNIILMIPKFFLPYTGNGDSENMKTGLTSDDRLSPPQVLGITVELAKALTLPDYLKNRTQVLEQQIEDEAYELERHLAEVQRINNEEDSRPEDVVALLQVESNRHDRNRNRISDTVDNALEGMRDGLVIQKAKEIDPPIRTAVAPLAMIFGIPTGILWLKSIIQGLGDVNTVSRDSANSEFDRAASAAENVGECVPVGRTADSIRNVLLCLSGENKDFSYNPDNTVNNVVQVAVQDDDIDSRPEYELELVYIGSEVPSVQQRYLQYGVDNAGLITLNWSNITEPSLLYKFDSEVRLKIYAYKSTRDSDTRIRASNTFSIPIKFSSTYPEQ